MRIKNFQITHFPVWKNVINANGKFANSALSPT